VAQGLIHRHPPPAIQATRRLQMAPCAKRDAQRVPRQLGVAMGARASSIDMYNNDVGKESAQKFMKQTGDLKAATLYFAS